MLQCAPGDLQDVIALTMPSFLKNAAGGCGVPASHAAKNSAVCLLSGRSSLISPFATYCARSIHQQCVYRYCQRPKVSTSNNLAALANDNLARAQNDIVVRTPRTKVS